MTMTMAMAMTGMLFGAIGCSAEDSAVVSKVETEPGKVLIAYYSWSPDGNTRYAAQQIQKATGGTLFEIKPKAAYLSEYRACVDQAKKECREGFKPELAATVEDFKKYDVIFIGSPNWWGTMAPPVLTFLTSQDFTGKKVIPFFTHGGGGMQSCERDVIKNAGKAELLPAKAFSGSSIRKADWQIAEWVGSLVHVTENKK